MSSERVEQLMRDVRGAKLPPRTFENGSDNFGVSHAWMSSTLNYWREEFDWSVSRCFVANSWRLTCSLFPQEKARETHQ